MASVEEKSERRGEVGDGGGVAFEEGDGRGVGVGEMGDDFGFTGSVVVLWGDTAVVGEHLFGFCRGGRACGSVAVGSRTQRRRKFL